MSWVGDPGPKGPKGYSEIAMTTRQIGNDLTSYLDGLNERIYMLEKQVRIQQGLLKNLNNHIRQLSGGEGSIHSVKKCR